MKKIGREWISPLIPHVGVKLPRAWPLWPLHCSDAMGNKLNPFLAKTKFCHRFLQEAPFYTVISFGDVNFKYHLGLQSFFSNLMEWIIWKAVIIFSCILDTPPWHKSTLGEIIAGSTTLSQLAVVLEMSLQMTVHAQGYCPKFSNMFGFGDFGNGS